VAIDGSKVNWDGQKVIEELASLESSGMMKRRPLTSVPSLNIRPRGNQGARGHNSTSAGAQYQGREKIRIPKVWITPSLNRLGDKQGVIPSYRSQELPIYRRHTQTPNSEADAIISLARREATWGNSELFEEQNYNGPLSRTSWPSVIRKQFFVAQCFEIALVARHKQSRFSAQANTSITVK
jgi:hypothetical protein